MLFAQRAPVCGRIYGEIAAAMKKQCLSVIASVLFLTLFLLASPGLGQPVIGVSFPGSVLFFDSQKKGMEEAAHKYNLTLRFEQAEWNAQNQLSQVQQFIKGGVAAIYYARWTMRRCFRQSIWQLAQAFL